MPGLNKQKTGWTATRMHPGKLISLKKAWLLSACHRPTPYFRAALHICGHEHQGEDTAPPRPGLEPTTLQPRSAHPDPRHMQTPSKRRQNVCLATLLGFLAVTTHTKVNKHF